MTIVQSDISLTNMHQRATRALKHATNQKLKALFNLEIFAKHDKLSLPHTCISLELFLIQIVFKNQ